MTEKSCSDIPGVDDMSDDGLYDEDADDYDAYGVGSEEDEDDEEEEGDFEERLIVLNCIFPFRLSHPSAGDDERTRNERVDSRARAMARQ